MGGLVKMSLVAYSDDSFVGKGIASLNIPVNPESYKLTKDIGHSENREQGKKETSVHFSKYEKEVLSFTVVFDGTGVIPGTNSRMVVGKVAELESIVYKYNDKIHQPNYVQVRWADLIFNGQLTSYSLNYNLFAPDGTPLRVKIDLSFSRTLEDKHSIIIATDAEMETLELKGEETIESICKKKYGSPLFAQDVAKVNKLSGFRNVKPGTKLVFPKVV